MSVNLPRMQRKDPLTQEDRTPSSQFQMYWQAFANAIEKAFADISAALSAAIAAQAAADAAQDSAIAALADAATAQSTADGAASAAAAAQGTANSAVPQDVTPAWGTPTGTLSRTALASYTGQTVSATYVQAEVQTIDDEVKQLSQTLAALITDLQSNGALT